MQLPVSLILLSIIALVLHILFGYVLPPYSGATPEPRYRKMVISLVVIILVVLFWFVIPVHIG